MCSNCVCKVDTGGDPWCNLTEHACFDIDDCHYYMSIEDYENNEKCKYVSDD